MKKFQAGLLAALASALVMTMSSCNNDNLVEQEVEVDLTYGIDLSKNEMANCYIVTSPQTYVFKADNRFNLGEGLPVPPEIHPVKAKLLWQTVRGSISEVELWDWNDAPYVRFKVEKAEGNALIAVLNEYNKIEWSWHIWMPQTKVESVASTTGYEVMNLNLGAMNATPGDPASYGMLYQWGRKDPFPASATLTGDFETVGAPLYDINGAPVSIGHTSWTTDENNTLEYAISHPTECISNRAHYMNTRDWLNKSDDSLWGNPEGAEKDDDNIFFVNKGRKTCYDPSPAGWRVAPVDAFRDYSLTEQFTWVFSEFNVADTNGDGKIDLGDYNFGWHFMTGIGTPLYFPAASRYDGSYGMLMGSMSGLWGNYWSNSPYSQIPGGAFCALSFQIKDMNGSDFVAVSPAAGASKADAFSIRCVRDK